MQTKENLELSKDDSLDIVGDTGYHSAKELLKCQNDNINAIVPEADNNKAQRDKGKYTRDMFKYDEKQDCYICPANKKLTRTPTPQVKNNKINFRYICSSTICKVCPLKEKCISIKTKSKRIYRWEHEHIIEKHRIKMQTQEAKDMVKKRSSMVEHPFGTIKRMLGWDHFLVRGKEKVSGENALIMFAYNFKRVLNILGTTMFQN